MKPAVQKPASLTAWLARVASGDEAMSLAAVALAQQENEAKLAAIEAEILATLQLLESLDLDRETLAAYVLHALRQGGVPLDALRLAKLPSSLRDLLDG